MKGKPVRPAKPTTQTRKRVSDERREPVRTKTRALRRTPRRV